MTSVRSQATLFDQTVIKNTRYLQLKVVFSGIKSDDVLNRLEFLKIKFFVGQSSSFHAVAYFCPAFFSIPVLHIGFTLEFYEQ